MYEAFTTLLRQVLLIYGTWLVSRGILSAGMLEPFIGAGLALFAFLWMVKARFWPQIKAFWKKKFG